ncbi:metal-dependent hydrolase [Cochlodiniinecator piscidefendens]|uniref:metal-dependent hydrolase n=1 Tax=Cochlodiniinecator piscidefendens TaxID=2715756 RepID=UPI001407F846|nr:metal-dependent hydrolase [Cochlodiniinecator piscidefendens]
MFIGHLPAGYILSGASNPNWRWVLPAALLGSILPDFDLIFFYFVDNRSIHHHHYWVHIPAFWALIAMFALPLLAWRGWFGTGLIFFAAIFLHLLLDTIVGGIQWAAPFSDHLYRFTEVPARYGNWVLSFVLHWTFLLELVVWGLALFLWFRKRET